MRRFLQSQALRPLWFKSSAWEPGKKAGCASLSRPTSYRFKNDSVTDYLELHTKNHYKIRKEGGFEILEVNKLEEAHARFFEPV
jgi:hypothetical protein